MERKTFLKTLLGASATIITMDGFSTLSNAFSQNKQYSSNTEKFASFGAVHLNITNLEKTTNFWTKIMGMKLRKTSDKSAEFGTEDQTLIVVHQTAKHKFKKGYSGIYHIAIHAPNNEAFASMLYRVAINKYPYSPVDHTMSKSIYLDDPDGINIEFALETPERFKRVITEGGIGMEGTDGVIRSASDRLDLDEVMKHLVDKDINKVISNDTYVGHIHLYANNVDSSNTFYKQLGFIPFNNIPQFMYADVGAGGPFHHRIAMNSWHGKNRPLAPKDSAGMKHFHIIFHTEEKLNNALKSVSSYEKTENGYWLIDPTGNTLLLTKI